MSLSGLRTNADAGPFGCGHWNGKAGLVMARLGPVRLNKARYGGSGLGKAWHGGAWLGLAWQGNFQPKEKRHEHKSD